MTAVRRGARAASGAGIWGVRLGDVAERLHRLTGLPLRLVLEDASGDGEGDGGETVVHDSLGHDAGEADLARRTLSTPSGRAARVAWRAGGGGSEDRGELVVAILERVVEAEAENRLFVDELAERYEEISLLTSISETLGAVIQLDRAAEKILQEVVDVTGAARATLWLNEESERGLRLLATRGMEDPAVRRIDPEDPDSLVAGVFRSQEPLLVDPEGEELDPEVRRGWEGFHGAPLLVVPVTYSPPEGDHRRVGVLALVGRRDGSRFSAGDRKLMGAVASQVGAAVENGRLVRESLRRERLATELSLAHDLQLKLLPDPEAVRDLTSVAARSEPAESVGGDFYHLIRLSGGRLGVMLGDVSSHGISASLIMAQTMSAAGIVAREEQGPGDVLARIEAGLRRELASTDMFVALFYAVVDPRGAVLRYASAGHPHAFLLDAGGARRLPAPDLPIGTADETGFSERTVDVGDGELLFLFTDGLFEPSAGQWAAAEARVTEVAAAAAADGPDEAVDAVFEASGRVRGEERDDRTAVAVQL